MKVVYYANDGEEFETEEECVEYEKEREEIKQSILTGVYALDEDLNKVSLDDLNNIGNVHYVMFNSLESADNFDCMQDEYGYVNLNQNVTLDKDEVYMYDDRDDEWVSLTKRMKYYQNVVNKLKEIKGEELW